MSSTALFAVSKTPEAPPSGPPSAPFTAGCCLVERNRSGRCVLCRFLYRPDPEQRGQTRCEVGPRLRPTGKKVRSVRASRPHRWTRAPPPTMTFSHFLLRGHRRISGGGHGQSPMRRADSTAFNGSPSQETENQPARKPVAAPTRSKISNWRYLRLQNQAVRPPNRPPVVRRRRNDGAKGGGRHFEILELTHRLLNHRLELVHRQRGDVVVESFHFKAEAAVKSSSLPIITSTYLAISRFTSGLGLSANALP